MGVSLEVILGGKARKPRMATKAKKKGGSVNLAPLTHARLKSRCTAEGLKAGHRVSMEEMIERLLDATMTDEERDWIRRRRKEMESSEEEAAS